MATKATVKPAEPTEVQTDVPCSSPENFLQKGKERGFVPYHEPNSILPPDDLSSEQIEYTMTRLSELSIDVLEDEEEAGEAWGQEP